MLYLTYYRDSRIMHHLAGKEVLVHQTLNIPQTASLTFRRQDGQMIIQISKGTHTNYQVPDHWKRHETTPRPAMELLRMLNKTLNLFICGQKIKVFCTFSKSKFIARVQQYCKAKTSTRDIIRNIPVLLAASRGCFGFQFEQKYFKSFFAEFYVNVWYSSFQ